MSDTNRFRYRSEIWFNDLAEPGETAVYLERFGNYGITRKELQSGKPVIGIAQTGMFGLRLYCTFCGVQLLMR